jgi:hypothetical protein
MESHWWGSDRRDCVLITLRRLSQFKEARLQRLSEVRRWDDVSSSGDALRDSKTVLLNAGSIDDRLREQDCRANIIHVAPTRSMLADALAQYLAWKQWKRWLLVVGSHDQDKLYADALRRAAGETITAEKMLAAVRSHFARSSRDQIRLGFGSRSKSPWIRRSVTPRSSTSVSLAWAARNFSGVRLSVGSALGIMRRVFS